VGFLLVDELGKKYEISIRQKGYGALRGSGPLCGRTVVLARPQTFMNRSGPAVGDLLKALGLSPGDLLLLHDDLDISWGRLRVKRGGGDAGHLGVRSVMESLGTGAFTRLRIGIGRPDETQEPAEYVLAPFTEEEEAELPDILARGVARVEEVLRLWDRDRVDSGRGRGQPLSQPVDRVG
jgi:PTH1 family peptidyl-tRNA hydrolase